MESSSNTNDKPVRIGVWPFSRKPLRPTQPPLATQPSAFDHALDSNYDEEVGEVGETPTSADAAGTSSTAFNRADETADLNFNNMSPTNSDEQLEEPLEYKDIAGQAALRSSDNRPDHHSIGTFLVTLYRGRAMPLKPLIISILWCVAAVVISYFSRLNYGPHRDGACRQWCTPLAVDSDALSYVGFALFLLTSFRVSEAYSRYMEAARVWTTITGTITSFAKYVMQAFPAGMIHKGDRERMLSFLVAFPIALKRDLRGERDLSELKSVLAKKDLAALQNSDNMPSYCLAVLSSYLLKARERESQFPQTFIVHLIRWVADLAGSADICDQIKSMPAPYSYVAHLNTFLGLWLFFLPFAIVEFMGWSTIPLFSFISYGILGVVSNATELEDPFGSDYNDLPLGRMSLKILKDVSDIHEAQREGKKTFLSEIDLNDVLLTTDKYWLNVKHLTKQH